jgi:hypothetical protein
MLEQGRPTHRVKGFVVAVALAVALFAPSWAGAKPPQPPPIPVEFVDGWDPNSAEGLARFVQEHRAKYRVPPGRLVGAFRVHLPNGQVKIIVLESVKLSPLKGRQAYWIEGHVEKRLLDTLSRLGWKRSWVGAGLIEYEPCESRGRHCRRLMARTLGHLKKIYAANPYPEDKAQRRQITSNFQREVRSFYRNLNATNNVMTPPRTPPGIGALRQRLALPPGLGGIDFGSLELRYVSDQGSGQGVGYAFRGAGAEVSDPAAGVGTARQSSDAFFTWLALPPSSHWVNLNPNEPDRIFDAQFGRTDAGKVLLEADLAMKKSIARRERRSGRSSTRSTTTSRTATTASRSGRRSIPRPRPCARAATSCSSSTRR